MGVVKWIEAQWGTISEAPVVFLCIAIIAWLAAMKFTRWRLGDEAAAAKERCQHLTEKIKELEGQKSDLLAKLESHGEDIKFIKQELNSRPRIHLGPEEPNDAKDGDLWINTK